MEKSPDAFRTISEVSKWLDTPTHVLRFWESRFPELAPVQRAGGRRYYRPEDVRLLGGIKELLHVRGQSIRDVQELLAAQGAGAVADMAPPAALESGAAGRPVHRLNFAAHSAGSEQDAEADHPGVSAGSRGQEPSDGQDASPPGDRAVPLPEASDATAGPEPEAPEWQPPTAPAQNDADEICGAADDDDPRREEDLPSGEAAAEPGAHPPATFQDAYEQAAAEDGLGDLFADAGAASAEAETLEDAAPGQRAAAARTAPPAATPRSRRRRVTPRLPEKSFVMFAPLLGRIGPPSWRGGPACCYNNNFAKNVGFLPRNRFPQRILPRCPVFAQAPAAAHVSPPLPASRPDGKKPRHPEMAGLSGRGPAGPAADQVTRPERPPRPARRLPRRGSPRSPQTRPDGSPG